MIFEDGEENGEDGEEKKIILLFDSWRIILVAQIIVLLGNDIGMRY